MQKAKSPSPGDTLFGVYTFGTTDPLLAIMAPNPMSPLMFAPGCVLPLSKVKGILELFAIVPLYSLFRWESHGWLEMGYAAFCHFSCSIFPLRRKMGRGDLEGQQGEYTGS